MVDRVKFDTRQLMEHSVEVMRQSVADYRTNGKASPLVGSVLWEPDGNVESAYRGELRVGDHAEYTLLERRNEHHGWTAPSCSRRWSPVLREHVDIPS